MCTDRKRLWWIILFVVVFKGWYMYCFEIFSGIIWLRSLSVLEEFSHKTNGRKWAGDE